MFLETLRMQVYAIEKEKGRRLTPAEIDVVANAILDIVRERLAKPRA